MNRQQILALLRRHGIQVADTATTAELRALLVRLPASESQACQQAMAFLETEVVEPQPVGNNVVPLPAPVVPVQAAAPPTPAPAVQPAAQPNGDVAQDVRTLNQIVLNLQAERDRERRQRLSQILDTLVAEDRVEGNEREYWLDQCVRDESILERLRNRPPINRPGHPALNVMITGDDPRSIASACDQLRNPIRSLLRGNRVPMQDIGASAMAMATTIRTHRQRLQPLLNANTIDSDLKRHVILQDIMRAFRRRIVMLGVFTTRFINVPLEGTNTVVVPYYELDTTTSKNFSASDGYVFDHDTVTGKRDVLINRRKYKPMDFTSDEFRRQPYFRPEINMMLKAEQLAVDVWSDVLANVTVANFAERHTIAAAAFDVDEIMKIRGVVQKKDWPTVGRALVLDTDYETNLLQDTSLKHFLNSGSDQTLREGATGRIGGFELFESPRIPDNSENLSGFAALPPALLVATAPIMPAPGVRQQLLNYDVVVDPDLGIAFEYRYWGEPFKDTDHEVVECNYGSKFGNKDALVRIVPSGS